MHLVLVAMPWHVLPHANAAAGLLSTAVADIATSEVYHGSLEFAERMLADASVTGGRDDLSPELYRQIGESGYLSGIAEWVFAGAIRGNPVETGPSLSPSPASWAGYVVRLPFRLRRWPMPLHDLRWTRPRSVGGVPSMT